MICAVSIKFFIADVSPQNLVAFCSYRNNKISIYDIETEQEYAQFDGASLKVSERTLYLVLLIND